MSVQTWTACLNPAGDESCRHACCLSSVPPSHDTFTPSFVQPEHMTEATQSEVTWVGTEPLYLKKSFRSWEVKWVVRLKWRRYCSCYNHNLNHSKGSLSLSGSNLFTMWPLKTEICTTYIHLVPLAGRFDILWGPLSCVPGREAVNGSMIVKKSVIKHFGLLCGWSGFLFPVSELNCSR